MRRVLRPVFIVVVLGAGLLVSSAQGQTATDLAVADAFAYATPVGTVYRIPNELEGGALLSKTTLSLDKARAIAAGYTPGELGEAFLQTTVVAPEGTPPQAGEQIVYENPGMVSAQTPPSDVFPPEDSVQGGGVDEDGTEAASVRVRTTETTARADAVGGIGLDQDSDLSFGSGGSRSTSELLDDGTVVSETHAFLNDIRIAEGLLRIAGIDSVGRVTIRPGQEPATVLDIDVTGAQLAGVPVILDQDGLRAVDTGLVSTGDVAAINGGLADLAEQGFQVTIFPGVAIESDDRSARVAGAALSLRGDFTDYVPTSVDTPAGPQGSPLGDVGTDDEILLGQVEASVFAAERGPIPDFGALPSLTGPSAAGTAAPSTPAAGSRAANVSADAGSPLPDPAGSAPGSGSLGDRAADAPFELVRREEPAGVAAVRVGYRIVMLCALAGALTHLVRRRARLT